MHTTTTTTKIVQEPQLVMELDFGSGMKQVVLKKGDNPDVVAKAFAK